MMLAMISFWTVSLKLGARNPAQEQQGSYCRTVPHQIRTGEQLYGGILQGSDRMATSGRDDPRHLLADISISRLRAVRTNRSTAPCSDLSSQQHCGRIRQIDARRVPAVSRTRTGVELRSGNTVGDCGVPRIWHSSEQSSSGEAVHGCQQAVGRTDQVPASIDLLSHRPLVPPATASEITRTSYYRHSLRSLFLNSTYPPFQFPIHPLFPLSLF
jgi:hypothetical protein